jgi:hypothetical protein
MTKIIVRRALSQEDKEKVYELRWKGYQKYFPAKEDMIDEFDNSDNVTLLLALTEDNNALGTMRILDQSQGKIELESYLDLNSILTPNEQPVGEATRFSIPSSQYSKLVKFYLWKSYLLYCRFHSLKTMLIWIRQAASRDYRQLLFEHCGSSGIFKHNRLSNVEHHTYKLEVESLELKYNLNKPHYYDFFYIQHHEIYLD